MLTKTKLKEENTKLQNEISDFKKHLNNLTYTKDKSKNNEELVTYYTGLGDFNALNPLFDLVKLDIAMKRGALNPFELLILCLMRLHFELAVVYSLYFQIIVSKCAKQLFQSFSSARCTCKM